MTDWTSVNVRPDTKARLKSAKKESYDKTVNDALDALENGSDTDTKDSDTSTHPERVVYREDVEETAKSLHVLVNRLEREIEQSDENGIKTTTQTLKDAIEDLNALF